MFLIGYNYHARGYSHYIIAHMGVTTLFHVHTATSSHIDDVILIWRHKWRHSIDAIDDVILLLYDAIDDVILIGHHRWRHSIYAIDDVILFLYDAIDDVILIWRHRWCHFIAWWRHRWRHIIDKKWCMAP